MSQDFEVIQIKSSRFTSNTYLLRNKKFDFVWLVDIGEFENVRKKIGDSVIKGLFLTHPHYDHIFCINELKEAFPSCPIFCSEACKVGLYDSKINLSRYHDAEVEYHGDNVQILKEGSEVELFPDTILKTIETPGHDISCLSFISGKYFFTGDSFIPNIPVVTKLRDGNKEVNQKTLERIHKMIEPDTIICPGHEKMGTVNEEAILSIMINKTLNH